MEYTLEHLGDSVHDFLARLKAVKAEPVTFLGICTNVVAPIGWDDDCRSYTDEVSAILSTWDHYSGDSTFPIPSTDESMDASAMYLTTGDYWDTETEYGRLRYEALDYIITAVEGWINAGT